MLQANYMKVSYLRLEDIASFPSNGKNYAVFNEIYCNLSHDVAFGSDVTPCVKAA